MSRQMWWPLLLLLPPYLALSVVGYWTLVQDREPVVLTYQHPRFLSAPAADRNEARMMEITEAPSGSYAWIYREVCVKKQIPGTSRGSWESGAFRWQSSERAIIPLPLGCAGHAFNVYLPTSNPTRDFFFHATWTHEINPLVTSEVVMPTIPIRVVAQ